MHPKPRTPQVDFSEWVAARGAALQRFARLVSDQEAADLVQEALSRAYPRWQKLAESGSAEAYVRRSIVNASVSAWRKDRRLVAVADPSVLPHAVQEDPASGLGDAEVAWRLCLELPPQQRAAVVLRFYEDLSFAQIAETLDCPESTARSHVHRALSTLRRRLDAAGADELGGSHE
ncbi:SigE family RNA polymerase sigma factor [Nocardioides limicola]|uniref:SigE family RNA polymerase sigma factor n=1 Tax=Nocardioides limicola TaxID=2803368 RepID=UPI0027DD9BB0|nr:SigE family RNA polymerase sigma factor [Nocardioides sp. DJM-14]